MRTTLMTAVAAVGLLAGSAWAAGDNSPASQSSPAPSAASSSAANSGASGSTSSSGMMTQAELQKQLGKEVKSKDGQKIGMLEDVILDSSGHPQQAVIDLADSSKNVAIAFSDLQQSGGDWMVKSQTKAQIAGLSSYQYDSTTVSLNHPKGSSGSTSSSSGSSSDLNAPSRSHSLGSTPSYTSPSGSTATPTPSSPSTASPSTASPSSRTQP
jgi:sporulation protein YlmC with PRC-barrel domain